MQNNEDTSEIFKEFKFHYRFAVICLSVLLALGALLYYKNDEDWRELFRSYGYTTQENEMDNIGNEN